MLLNESSLLLYDWARWRALDHHSVKHVSVATVTCFVVIITESFSGHRDASASGSHRFEPGFGISVSDLHKRLAARSFQALSHAYAAVAVDVETEILLQILLLVLDGSAVVDVPFLPIVVVVTFE